MNWQKCMETLFFFFCENEEWVTTCLMDLKVYTKQSDWQEKPFLAQPQQHSKAIRELFE